MEDSRKEVNSNEQKADFLNKLIFSLEETEGKLEKAYRKENYEQFRIMKEFILKIQKKISETIR